MPELPEVEVTRRGIAPHLEGRTIASTVIRHYGMRWPVPAGLPAILQGLTVRQVGRRGKYLLLECVPAAPGTAPPLPRDGAGPTLRAAEEVTRREADDAAWRAGAAPRPDRGPAKAGAGAALAGASRMSATPAAPAKRVAAGAPGRATALRAAAPGAADYAIAPVGWLILHLGMSGSLSIVGPDAVPGKHEHFDLTAGANTLRLNDPRRFGAVLWHPAADGPPESHPLLAGLGVEPLTPAFTAELLFRATRGRKASIKQVLLAGDIVVGVGNIYASESLFRARIRPTTAAGRLSRKRIEQLVPEIRAVLGEAIAKGGSTLRDFRHTNGQSGYFQLDYFVYDRTGEPCKICQTRISRVVQGQRSTFYCPSCQH